MLLNPHQTMRKRDPKKRFNSLVVPTLAIAAAERPHFLMLLATSLSVLHSFDFGSALRRGPKYVLPSTQGCRQTVLESESGTWTK